MASLTGSLLFACEGADVPADAAASSSRKAPEVEEFFRLAEAPGDAETLAEAGVEYALELPPPARLAVARVAVERDDERFRAFGAGLLLELGETEEADRAFGALVVDGVDLAGAFYSWMHAEDPHAATRRYVGISRAVLDRYQGLTELEKSRADLFLCTEGFGESLSDCSLAAVRRRLAEASSS